LDRAIVALPTVAQCPKKSGARANFPPGENELLSRCAQRIVADLGSKIPNPLAPAAMYLAMDSGRMPPTGKIGTSVAIRDRSVLICAGENVSAGKSFSPCAPLLLARNASVAVANPGNEIMPQFTAW